MRKIVALIGSARKKATYSAVLEFEKNLKVLGDIEFEAVFLADYRLEYCRGCKLCFDRGEQICPLVDDRDVLIDKLEQADGVIFATPNYAFHIPAIMKNMFDRMAFIFHRPRFFGKTCTWIVTQGIYGGKSIGKYLEHMGRNFGFESVKGCVLHTLEPATETAKRKNAAEIAKAAGRFYRALERTRRSPSLLRLLLFRMTRTGVGLLAEGLYDHKYFSERGWLTSDYYYAASLGPVKKTLGRLFDSIGRLAMKS